MSLPLADFVVQVEQLVNVVRRKGRSADLTECLDALSIRINFYHVTKTLHGIDDAESAIHFFTWAAQQPDFSHNVHTCTSFVNILARAKEFDKIWEFLSELHGTGSELTDGCFNIIIKAYGELGNDREAIRTLHKMVKFGVLPTAYSYNTLISALLKSQKLDLAMEIYHEMQQVPHAKNDKFAHSMMISALCNAGRVQEAHEMVINVTERGCPINNVIWTALINGFCKAGNVEKGIELFSMMKDMGLEPNVVTYGTIIGGFCKVGKLSDAMAYLERMKCDGIEPTAVTYTPLLDAFCKAGRIDEGRELLKKVCANGADGNSVLYSVFVFAYSQSERMDEACALYNEMVKNGCWPNVTTYAVLLQGLLKAGRLTEALNVSNDMKKMKCAPNAAIYKVMIGIFAKVGFKYEAEKMCKEMLAQGYECSTSTCRSMIKLGSLDTAKEMLSMMLKTSGGVKASTVCLLLKGFCDASRVDVAYQVHDKVLEHGFLPNTQCYHILIHGAYKARDLEKALELCSEMHSKGCEPDIYTYAALYNIAWKAKRADALLDIYVDMRTRHVRANSFVFTLVIKALCTMQKVPEACDIFFQILEDGLVSSDGDEHSLGLGKNNFFEVQVFLPLLNHFQNFANVKAMVSIWDFVLESGMFSWYGKSGIESPETLQ